MEKAPSPSPRPIGCRLSPICGARSISESPPKQLSQKQPHLLQPPGARSMEPLKAREEKKSAKNVPCSLWPSPIRQAIVGRRHGKKQWSKAAMQYLLIQQTPSSQLKRILNAAPSIMSDSLGSNNSPRPSPPQRAASPLAYEIVPPTAPPPSATTFSSRLDASRRSQHVMQKPLSRLCRRRRNWGMREHPRWEGRQGG